MKIAIAVHGRFYAFEFALAMMRRGHEVRVFTNYPAAVAQRFGLPRESVTSFLAHGLVSRAAEKLARLARPLEFVALQHRMFGRWAAERLSHETWDCIKLFSGIAEETLRAPRTARCRMVVRGSSHIRTQSRLLNEEAARSQRRIDRPAPWMVARETREYQLADHILTLSSFARDTFVAEGVAADRVLTLPLGVDLGQFRPSPEVVEQRCRRIRAGLPLRVLTVGTLSFRKGLLDYARIVRALSGQGFEFRFVGDIPPEARSVLPELAGKVELVPRQPQADLPKSYAWADLFLFPTIEDGYGVVLSQANAGAVPLLCTSHCSGSDLVKDGRNGWVLPIREPELFIRRLQWCASRRDELAAMVNQIDERFVPRDWDHVAADFERLYEAAEQASHGPAAAHQGRDE
jgi:glycosyltransferase involved in cell wall biosynthesis